MRLEAGPAQGPATEQQRRSTRARLHTCRGPHTTHTAGLPPRNSTPSLCIKYRLARFIPKQPVRRAFAVPWRCCTKGWGWGGAASYLDCSLCRGLLRRLTNTAPVTSRKIAALFRWDLGLVGTRGVGRGAVVDEAQPRTSAHPHGQFLQSEEQAGRRRGCFQCGTRLQMLMRRGFRIYARAGRGAAA